MLKAPEIEEPLDLFLYRPLAFALVKPLARTRITPNHITIFSLLPGLAAAACFWRGHPDLYLAGAGLLFLTNVLDCADGMLARVRGTGSLTGYILDGAADYVIQVTFVVAFLHGIAVHTGDVRFSWLVGAPAAVSAAWWCARVDRFRNEWLERVYGRRRDPRQELASLRSQAAGWRHGSHRGDRALIGLYALYVRLWYSAPPLLRTRPSREDMPAWRRRREPFLRLAVLMGPTMHISLVIAASVARHPEWYVWAALGFGAPWGLLILAARTASDQVAEAGGWIARRDPRRGSGHAPASAD